MTFGVDHINSTITINRLGNAYQNQEKYDEAMTQYERALRISEEIFGVDHVNSAGTIINIGVVYKSRNQMDLAKSWLLRGHGICLSHLGELHPFTQRAVIMLDDIQGKEGDEVKRTAGKSKPSWKSKLKKLLS